MPEHGPASEGDLLAAEVQAELERLGLERLTARYVPDKNVVRVTWQRLGGTGTPEGVEFIASREWVERMRPVFLAMAKGREQD